MTEDFSNNGIYGLTSQMRRAAVSIPANIAEDYRKRGKQDFKHITRFIGRIKTLFLTSK